jgi:RES domain-containing protein
MAPFTHINRRGSRFADGTFGAYYAASTLDTAIAETIHHFEQYASDSSDPPRSEDMRALVGVFDAELEDVMAEAEPLRSRLLDPDDYSESQKWARGLRESGSAGISYPSVRHVGGRCVAAFWPDIPGIPVQERHLQYHWNGERVDRYFDYSDDRWIAWP